MDNKKRQVEKIIRDIKSIKIQGARNIAKSALYAYSLMPEKNIKEKLISARPTEPMLINVLNMLDKKTNYDKIFSHFDLAQSKINKNVYKLIKNNTIIFTHCHSTNVTNALIYSHKKGKKFEVYNTETRPLFQGRRTAKELSKAGINVTNFVDSAINIALEGDQNPNREKQCSKNIDLILIGSDAILKTGVINKVGSGMIAELASLHKIPVYIVADSWKFFPKKLELEQRDFREVWKRVPIHIKVRNPAFEFVDKKYITGIISELGILKFDKFIDRVNGK